MKNALHDEFVTEIEEMLDSCISSLLSLEDHALDLQSPELKLVMRHLHSAKGGCSMFDFPRLSHGFHQIEDTIADWTNTCTLPEGGLDHLFAFFDVAKKTLRQSDSVFDFEPWGQPRASAAASESSKASVAEKPEPKKTAAPSLFRRAYHDLSHPADYEAELLAYIIDPDHAHVLKLVKELRLQSFLTKSYKSLTRAMMNLQEDHPDVIILKSRCYDHTRFNLVQHLVELKLPIPVVIIDERFSLQSLSDYQRLGVSALLSTETSVELMAQTSRAQARSYRSQKLLSETINLAMYQLGVINHPGQTLIPEPKLNELKEKVRSLLKAKKAFSDIL